MKPSRFKSECGFPFAGFMRLSCESDEKRGMADSLGDDHARPLVGLWEGQQFDWGADFVRYE